MEREEVTRGPYAGEEPRSAVLQSMVRPSEKKRVEEIVRARGHRSISDWLYSIVRRELDADRGSDASAAA